MYILREANTWREKPVSNKSCCPVQWNDTYIFSWHISKSELADKLNYLTSQTQYFVCVLFVPESANGLVLRKKYKQRHNEFKNKIIIQSSHQIFLLTNLLKKLDDS